MYSFKCAFFHFIEELQCVNHSLFDQKVSPSDRRLGVLSINQNHFMGLQPVTEKNTMKNPCFVLIIVRTELR